MQPDRFTQTIIQEHLRSAADEMFVRLGRASKSPIIYEVLDYACALLTARGELMAEAQGVPGFTGVLPFAVRSIMEKHPPSSMSEGDIFATNDPYGGGGTHLSDVCLVGPIFYQGELIAYAANKAHWTEVGGMAAGSWTTDATEIFQEGLQLPAVKLYQAGHPVQGLIDLISANVRLPEMTLSDLYAGVAAIRTGEKRLHEICRRYSRGALNTSVAEMLDAAESVARDRLAELPEGVYRAEDWMDDDGLSDTPIPIQVKVTIENGKFIADFTGSSPQVPGPINGTWARLQSSCRVMFKAITAPDYPNSEGSFRPVEVICPEGTIFRANRPAPVSTYWEAGAAAVDLLWRALYPISKNRLSVGHFLSICGTSLSGIDGEGRLFVLVEPQAGGWGAGIGKDGESGLVAQGDGETYNIPVEVCEARYPLLVEQYGFHVLPAGAGQFRGGRGLIRDYRVLCKRANLTTTFGRHRFPPWGFDGGEEGSINLAAVIPGGSAEPDVERGKLARHPLQQGDLVRLITGSGGGLGNPLARPVQRVQEDVKNGLVTLARARLKYGVNLDPDTLEVISLSPARSSLASSGAFVSGRETGDRKDRTVDD